MAKNKGPTINTFRKKLLFACLLSFIIFGFINLLGSAISKYLENWSPPIMVFYDNTILIIEWIAVGIIIFTIILIALKDVFQFIWDHTIGLLLNDFFQSINQHLSNFENQVSQITENIDRYIKNRGGPLQLTECRYKNDYDAYIDYAFSNIYGSHTKNNKSFYNYIKKEIIEPYCCEPHPSQVTKTITTKVDSNNSDYIIWNEQTDYKVHHVEYKERPKDAYYMFNYFGTSFAPNISPENWASALKFSFRIDGEDIVQDQPKVKKGLDNEEGFFCWKEGNWISIRYIMLMKLTKEWTDVSVYESSLNYIEDTSFTLNTTKVTYGYKLNFTAPEGYKILQKPFISHMLAYKGLPDFIKSEYSYINPPVISSNRDNNIIIEINNWILPGIILQLNWMKEKVLKA